MYQEQMLDSLYRLGKIPDRYYNQIKPKNLYEAYIGLQEQHREMLEQYINERKQREQQQEYLEKELPIIIDKSIQDILSRLILK